MRRVLVDTIVIVSALIFPGSTPVRALSMAMEREQLVLSDWILDELREVVERKWPDRLSALGSRNVHHRYRVRGFRRQ